MPDTHPKGYFTSFCFFGWIKELNRYIPFASESDYYDYLKKGENNE